MAGVARGADAADARDAARVVAAELELEPHGCHSIVYAFEKLLVFGVQ